MYYNENIKNEEPISFRKPCQIFICLTKYPAKEKQENAEGILVILWCFIYCITKKSLKWFWNIFLVLKIFYNTMDIQLQGGHIANVKYK